LFALQSLPIKTLELCEDIPDESQEHTVFFYTGNCFPTNLRHLHIEAGDTLIQNEHIFALKSLSTCTLRNAFLQEPNLCKISGMCSLEKMAFSSCKKQDGTVLDVGLPDLIDNLPSKLTSLSFQGCLLTTKNISKHKEWPSQLKHLDFCGSIWHDRTLLFLPPYVSGLTSLDITCTLGHLRRSEVSARGLTDFVQNALMPEMRDLRISQDHIDIDDMWDLIEFVKANKQTKFPKLRLLGVCGFQGARERLTKKYRDATKAHFQLALD
jgi:hypothetical protein